jgi:hypothetical protein
VLHLSGEPIQIAAQRNWFCQGPPSSCRDNPGLGATAHSAHSLTCRSSSVPASKDAARRELAPPHSREEQSVFIGSPTAAAPRMIGTQVDLWKNPLNSHFTSQGTRSVFALPETGDPSPDVLSVSLPRPTSGCAALAFALQGCCGATRMLLSALDGRREDQAVDLVIQHDHKKDYLRAAHLRGACSLAGMHPRDM